MYTYYICIRVCRAVVNRVTLYPDVRLSDSVCGTGLFSFKVFTVSDEIAQGVRTLKQHKHFLNFLIRSYSINKINATRHRRRRRLCYPTNK